MRYDSILIVTYGRSGSTLLQGVLNSIEGCLVRGENFNCFHPLYQSYERLLKAKAKAGTVPADPWYGAHLLDEQIFIEQIEALARKLLLADADENRVRAYGFKEIRYPRVGDELEAYLDFLEKVFPNPAFVFNTRNLDQVVKSDWWADGNYWKAKRKLAAFEHRCLAYMQAKPNWFHIRYEDIIGKTPNLEHLFEFLGAEYDPAAIEQVLAVPHSYPAGSGEFPAWRIALHRWRRRWLPWMPGFSR
jgi:hypothetical protein